MDETNSTTFNTEDLDDSDEDLFFCEVCNEKYQLQQLYACYQGHFFCENCYKQEYYIGKESRCPHFTCNAWIDHANVLPQQRYADGANGKMFPEPGFYVTGRVSSTHLSRLGTNTASQQSLSKSSRPLFCPLRHCNKAIAVKSVDYHFECEHKDVATITTHLEARNGMEFLAEDIKVNEILCICIIKLRKPKDCHDIGHEPDPLTTPLKSDTPSLLIMATKLKLDNTDNPYRDNFYDCQTSEKYFIWVSSNMCTQYSYTLALSSLCNRLRVKYFGPLMTLNEDFRILCTQSKGLVLTDQRVLGMTDSMTKPLVLDILVHGPDGSEPNEIL